VNYLTSKWLKLASVSG